MFRTRLIQLLTAFLVCACEVHADHYPVDYECQPNGDVTVQNPELGVIYSATAGTESSVCNVTAAPDLIYFTVSGCVKNEDIVINLSSRKGADAMGDGIIGGGYSETYVIKCMEISMEGVMFENSMSVVVAAQAANTSGQNMSTLAAAYSQAPVTPIFTVTSSIWNSALTEKVAKADVGVMLKWKIQGPYEYDLLPWACTVNPTNTLGTTPIVPVIENGCSVIDMVSNFVALSDDPTEKGTVVSALYAFKFTMSDDLTISCSVKLCTRGDETCVASCDSRRRRAAEELVEPQFNVVSHLTIGDSGTATLAVSYILMIFACTIALSQRLIYLQI